MSLSADDIVYMQTVDGLGGALTTEIPEESLHNIFDPVSGKEAKLGNIDYRCVYVKNKSTTASLYNAKMYIMAQPVNASESIRIGKGSSPLNSTEQRITDDNTKPLNVNFYDAASLDNAIELGDIPNGSYKSVWIERTVLANAPVSENSKFFLVITGDIF